LPFRCRGLPRPSPVSLISLDRSLLIEPSSRNCLGVAESPSVLSQGTGRTIH
jgi:hypothetical protein